MNTGYGHIVPRTNEGRVACLMYALLGIPLILVTIADMGRFLSVLQSAENTVHAQCSCIQDGSQAPPVHERPGAPA
ncbi:unnamed protein product [Toxocara canis]|uniref:Ion_trans_2 domain-containing protein n=1 Tax=Toxocara canis TaxID=6265 RepID=A0A183U4S1_TOXCA|nr:unnamed protein product [Toxocara canis]